MREKVRKEECNMTMHLPSFYPRYRVMLLNIACIVQNEDRETHEFATSVSRLVLDFLN